MLTPYQGISCLPTSAAFPRPKARGRWSCWNHSEEVMTSSYAARIGREGGLPPARKSSRKSRPNSRAFEKGLLGNVVWATAAEGRPRLWNPSKMVAAAGDSRDPRAGGLLCIETPAVRKWRPSLAETGWVVEAAKSSRGLREERLRELGTTKSHRTL